MTLITEPEYLEDLLENPNITRISIDRSRVSWMNAVTNVQLAYLRYLIDARGPSRLDLMWSILDPISPLFALLVSFVGLSKVRLWYRMRYMKYYRESVWSLSEPRHSRLELYNMVEPYGFSTHFAEFEVKDDNYLLIWEGEDVGASHIPGITVIPRLLPQFLL